MSFGLTGAAILGTKPLFGALTLDLPQGWTCLLGPSGAGKTTLLRLLAGLPTEARFSGQITTPDSVAYMAQDDLLQPRLSVLNNVLIGQHLRGQRPDTPRALALLDSVGLADFAGRRPDSLSGGQRQRVALARALMEDAPLALLDEPFSALDATTRRRMQDLTVDLLTGRSVLLVTHDPFEALRLGHRVYVLKAGRLLEFPDLKGPPLRELDSPAFAAAYRLLMADLAVTT